MKKKSRKSLFSVALSAVLLASSVTPVWADDAGSPPAILLSIANPIGSIALTSQSKLNIQEVNLLTGEELNTVSFTAELVNGSDRDMQFVDYWIRLNSGTGAVIDVQLQAQDKDKNKVAAGTSQQFHFYAKVSKATALADLKFQVIKWDFDAPNFERVVGEIAVPDSYSLQTPSDSKRSVLLSGVPITTYVKRVNVSKNDINSLPTVSFMMVNSGSRSIKLPDLQFTVETADGLSYPMNVSGLTKDTVLQPLEDKEGILTAIIPQEAGLEGWKLSVKQTIEGGASDGTALVVPVAEYDLPQAKADDVSLGAVYEFSNKHGIYTASMTGLHRLPWEDEDLLTANVIIANQGTESLPIPDFTGYFELDDATKVEAVAVNTDKVISLNPGSELQLQLIGKIPFTTQFKRVKLLLQENETVDTLSGSAASSTDKPVKVDLVQFYHNSDLLQVGLIPNGAKRKLTAIGRQADYSVRSVMTFTGKSSDIYAAQLAVENLEKRHTDIAKLVAHFRAADGTVYPAQVTELSEKVRPGATGLLYVWSSVPKSYATEGLQLLIGDAVKDGKLAEKDPDGYVNAASFVLPAEQKEPKASFKELEIAPYTISMSNFGTQLNFVTGEVELKFEYELTHNLLMETNMDNQKLIVEMEDTRGKFKMSHYLDLETGKDESKVLDLGFHQMKLIKADENLKFNVEDMEKYRLNVYHEFQSGQKKLLATKDLYWFMYND
ncbi:hypothetical protein [Paenibacillus sp. y28]|uniref:hypothetical protein n=1 Tax=Paenibacillus sp. y28 TaxID=3129110 RepID=UPI00301A454F